MEQSNNQISSSDISVGIKSDSSAFILESKCPMCRKPFNEINDVPNLLTCGHSLCSPCVTKLRIETPNEVKCPECSNTTQTSEIRNNYALAHAVARVSSGTDLNRSISIAAEKVGVTCPICMDAYNIDRIPYVLKCGHTFCGECLSHLHVDGGYRCPNRCGNQGAELPITVNRGLLSILNSLRVMNGLAPTNLPEETSPPPPPTAVPTTPINTSFPTQNFTPSPTVPRFLLMFILAYVCSAAALSVVIGLNQELGCYSLRQWLLVFAALLVIPPCITVLMNRFPSKARHLHWLRSIAGFVFIFWLYNGVSRAWLKPQSDCSRGVVWMTSTVLLSIHFTLAALQLFGETMFCCCRRSLAVVQARAVAQFF